MSCCIRSLRRFAAKGESTMRWLSSISRASCAPRSQVLLTPKLSTTSSRVLLALQKLEYELRRFVVSHFTLGRACCVAGWLALGSVGLAIMLSLQLSVVRPAQCNLQPGLLRKILLM